MLQRFIQHTLIALSLMLIYLSSAHAETVVIQTSSKDAYLYDFHNTNNFGHLAFLRVGPNDITVIRFPIFATEGGPVPNNASIQSATLSLYKFSPYDATVQAHRLLKDWQELSVTWDSPWTTPGAAHSTDIHATADGTGTITDWNPGWLEITVTNGVQAMAQGATNYGWKISPVSGYGLEFYSKEHNEANLRPKLTIVYSGGGGPNEPPTVSLTQPTTNATYLSPATVQLEATAADSDGTITKVEFYQGTTKLGEAGTSPYRYTWENVAAGNYTITAKAIDNLNATTDSTGINITVNAAPPSATIELRQDQSGYSGAQDAYLYDFHNTSNFGQLAFLRIGPNDTGVIRFALFNHEGGPIPDNATIQSATLSIYKFSPYNGTIQANRLLKGWQENSVTWDSPWTVPGAQDTTDINVTADGSGTITDWSPGWLEINVKNGVQAMAQGANNYGWRLKQTAGYGLEFYSKEHTDITLRPKLTITYSSQQTQDGIYYIHTDHLNTPRVITDTTNKIVWRWNSDPFGTTAANEDPDNDGTTFTFNLRFPGQYFDKESNLHYNYFRDYNPTTGRYVQSDPIGILSENKSIPPVPPLLTRPMPDALNHLYGYAANNPILWADPFGLEPEYCGKCAPNDIDCLLRGGNLCEQKKTFCDQEELNSCLAPQLGALALDARECIQGKNLKACLGVLSDCAAVAQCHINSCQSR